MTELNTLSLMLNDVLHNIYFRIKCTRFCFHCTRESKGRNCHLKIDNLIFFRFTKFNFRYDVVVSSDIARTKTNGCIFFKLRDPSIDVLPSHYYSHKFVCVAPYNTDTLLLINIPKTMLEKVIKVVLEL